MYKSAGLVIWGFEFIEKNAQLLIFMSHFYYLHTNPEILKLWMNMCTYMWVMTRHLLLWCISLCGRCQSVGHDKEKMSRSSKNNRNFTKSKEKTNFLGPDKTSFAISGVLKTWLYFGFIIYFQVRDQWEKITDFSDSMYPASIGESTRHLIGVLSDLDGGIGGKKGSGSSSSGGTNGIDVVGYIWSNTKFMLCKD